jgi:hypothetical protein
VVLERALAWTHRTVRFFTLARWIVVHG